MEVAYAAASCAVSFAATLLCTRWWLDASRRAGFVSKDMNKAEERYAAESGGVWASVGAAFGLLSLVAFYKYLTGVSYSLDALFALALILLLASFLGFLDDALGWKKGLRPWQRVLATGPLALPLVIVKAGTSTMAIPFVGVVDFGLLYPLVLVPLGVVGASNAFNMLAGYNGLEAGMGLLLSLFTAAYAALKGIDYVAYASLVMASALAAFLAYNWYPAKAFPGNSLTYGFGAYYAGLVVLGNFEKFGVLLFSLYFAELALFLRGLANGVYKENFGRPAPGGRILPPYEKSFSLTHWAIFAQQKLRGYATEKGVVAILLLLQTALGAALLGLAAAGLL